MPLKLFAAALMLSVFQLISFITVWYAALSQAEALGRIWRGDIGFGITIIYGLNLIGFLFMVSSFSGIFSNRRHYRWIAVLICLAVWSWWMMPSFNSRPFRGPLYFLMGSGILTFGALIWAPMLRGWLTTRALTQEQNNGQRGDISAAP